MIDLYGNGFFEVITADALYTNEPYVMFVHELSKYLVSRVKDERTTLYQEIEALSALVTPIHIDDREEQVEYWIREVPDLHISLGWKIPNRPISRVQAHRGCSKGLQAGFRREGIHPGTGVSLHGYSPGR